MFAVIPGEQINAVKSVVYFYFILNAKLSILN